MKAPVDICRKPQGGKHEGVVQKGSGDEQIGPPTYFCLFRGIHCFCCVQLSGNPITGALSCRGPRPVAGEPPRALRFARRDPGSPAGPVLDDDEPATGSRGRGPDPYRERARPCHVPGSAMCCSLGRSL
jgi:hypothetical protein